MRDCLVGVLVADELAEDELLYLPAVEDDRLFYNQTVS